MEKSVNEEEETNPGPFIASYCPCVRRVGSQEYLDSGTALVSTCSAKLYCLLTSNHNPYSKSG